MELHKHISWANTENNPQEKAVVEHINGSFINFHVTFDFPFYIWDTLWSYTLLTCNLYHSWQPETEHACWRPGRRTKMQWRYINFASPILRKRKCIQRMPKLVKKKKKKPQKNPPTKPNQHTHKNPTNPQHKRGQKKCWRFIRKSGRHLSSCYPYAEGWGRRLKDTGVYVWLCLLQAPPHRSKSPFGWRQEPTRWAGATSLGGRTRTSLYCTRGINGNSRVRTFLPSVVSTS